MKAGSYKKHGFAFLFCLYVLQPAAQTYAQDATANTDLLKGSVQKDEYSGQKLKLPDLPEQESSTQVVSGMSPESMDNKSIVSLDSFQGRPAGTMQQASMANLAPRKPASNPQALKLAAVQQNRKLEILWDKWQEMFYKAIRDNWNCPCNGEASVRYTVYKNRTLRIEIIKSGGILFDRAIIDAASKLNRSPLLDFPPGSQRKSVSYERGYLSPGPASGGVIHDVETILL